ncbi:hypothetical protein BJV77DRAFT_304582 [Russula vinacea]|nr:hypothetical protein BJV77DRAFT_304582 [Russula vinacea]
MKSPPSSPSDTRIQSLLAALLQARWPKTESEQPIFGQTAPRAVSPFRGKQRPPPRSMPRSILRTDPHPSPRTVKSQRSLGCVKLLSSQVFGSSALRWKRKSMSMRNITRTSRGAPGRIRTATPPSRFLHQANVRTTTRFSSASKEDPINTQSLPTKTAPQSRALCRWHEPHLFGK